MHPGVPDDALEELSNMLDLPLCAGSINRGCTTIGAGMAVNDYTALCGYASTASELSVIEGVFNLDDACKFGYEFQIRTDLIEALAYPKSCANINRLNFFVSP